MNEDVQRFIHASIQEGIQHALRELGGVQDSTTPDSSDVEPDAFFEESFEDGVELPEKIFGLFPDVPQQRKNLKRGIQKNSGTKTGTKPGSEKRQIKRESRRRRNQKDQKACDVRWT